LLAVKRVWVEKDQKTRNCYTLLWQPFLGVDLKEAGTKRTHRANGGNAQSVAHRSGENTQNMHPVPPGIPSEDDGVVGAGMSRSDRQSSARRSVDDLQDPASGWPAIPREDGGAVPDGRPPGDTQYSAHQSGSDPPDTTPERPGIPRDDDRTVAERWPPSDAQYPAHRSEGNPPDIAAERPAISRDDNGAAADNGPPSDMQYPAHQPEGDPPDPARPAILGGDAGTVPDAMQPGVAGLHVVNTQSHELSRSQTQPLDSVPSQYMERPLGPGDCKRHSFPGKCKKCGATVKETHLIMRVMSGAFCERCCPACHPGA
jgi:hypothetical protein